MKVFEEEYNFESSTNDCIMLGIRALHDATEGKFDVNMVEIGIIEMDNPEFRKMSKEEVAQFVDKFEK